MTIEGITVPARFLTTVVHLITVLTILYDVSNVAHRAIDDEADYNKGKDTLTALTWTSVACFIVEFLGLFSGVSMFLPTINMGYIFLHINGLILTALFSELRWDIDVFLWIVIITNCIPAFSEMLIAFAVFKLNVMEYS